MKNFNDKKIVITGATGGIGGQVSDLLAKAGAKLIFVGSDEKNLRDLCDKTKNDSNYVLSDLSTPEGIYEAAAIISEIDNVDYLINLAGISYFGSLGLQDFDKIVRLYNINILAPTVLCQAVLPNMVERNSGHIVNFGSFFGSIGFGFFATYSASKAAIRTFSEALRRELSSSNIKVSYIVPRAVRTPINNDKNMELLKRTKTKIDEPEIAAKKIVEAILKEKKNAYLGFPESKFVKLNYLAPSLVDSALKGQMKIAQEILMEE